MEEVTVDEWYKENKALLLVYIKSLFPSKRGIFVAGRFIDVKKGLLSTSESKVWLQNNITGDPEYDSPSFCLETLKQQFDQIKKFN